MDLRVFDAAGRLVRILDSTWKEPGRHEFYWDGSDGNGVQTPPGIYFYRMMTEDFRETRKLVRLR